MFPVTTPETSPVPPVPALPVEQPYQKAVSAVGKRSTTTITNHHNFNAQFHIQGSDPGQIAGQGAGTG